MPTPYFKFPRTPHLWNTGAATRDDIRLDPKLSAMYFGPNAQTVCVTEKVDGANLGISLTANWEIECQHRGQQIVYTTSPEYSKLKEWLQRKAKFLCDILEPERHILYGEWCQRKHSILYDNLPDYLLVFDCYDRKQKKFMSRKRVESLCQDKFAMTRCIGHLRFEHQEEIEKLMNETMSCYKKKTPGPIEGLYLKIEDEENGWNVHRCKLVRSDFIQGIESTGHWTHGEVVHNSVRLDFDYENENDGDIGNVEDVGNGGNGKDVGDAVEVEEEKKMEIETVDEIKEDKERVKFVVRDRLCAP